MPRRTHQTNVTTEWYTRQTVACRGALGVMLGETYNVVFELNAKLANISL